MNLFHRYKRLSPWNKLAVLASLAAIFAFFWTVGGDIRIWVVGKPTPPPIMHNEQTTKGHSSPAVAGVKGDVTITIGDQPASTDTSQSDSGKGAVQ